MMSMYADYLKELSEDLILETDFGFVTYRYLDDKRVYLIHIFVKPEFRKQGAASSLANTIAAKAKADGYTHMLGTVVPSAKTSTDSMKTLLAYGMTPFAIDGNMVVFKKEL